MRFRNQQHVDQVGVHHENAWRQMTSDLMAAGTSTLYTSREPGDSKFITKGRATGCGGRVRGTGSLTTKRHATGEWSDGVSSVARLAGTMRRACFPSVARHLSAGTLLMGRIGGQDRRASRRASKQAGRLVRGDPTIHFAPAPPPRRDQARGSLRPIPVAHWDEWRREPGASEHGWTAGRLPTGGQPPRPCHGPGTDGTVNPRAPGRPSIGATQPAWEPELIAAGARLARV